MSRCLLTICLVFVLKFNAYSQAYGLAFNGHESVQEKRTAIELAPGDSLCFSGNMRLEFDLNFVPGNKIYFGYIVRIINGHQNIDLIYDERSKLFRIIDGLAFSGISFSIDSLLLYHQWNRIALEFNRGTSQVQVFFNGKQAGTAHTSINGSCFQYYWGANDEGHYQTRDIPHMRIKDIRLFENKKLAYEWPLNETAGNTSVDDISGKKAAIKNPNWIKPKHQRWTLVDSMVIRGNAIAAFDAKTERLIITGTDSVINYDTKNLDAKGTSVAMHAENLRVGSLAVYDTITNRMYDVFIDAKKVATYLPAEQKWDYSFADGAFTEFLHANKFVSSVDTSLYVIGGYGQMKYKNLVQRYHFATKTWEVLKVSGDFFAPRYLAALGANAAGDTAYIIGGYGSLSGDQMLYPGNFFDMFEFDVRNRKFRKLLELDSSKMKFTFANSLVIDPATKHYYGLIFPNESFNSSLQLIEGSLTKPWYQLLGSSIPYAFYDIQSFVDLYYAPSASKMLAVSFFYSKEDAKDKLTTVKIYSIDFPPEAPPVETKPEPVTKNDNLKYIVLAAALLLLAAGIIYLRRRKPAVKEAAPLPETAKNEISVEVPSVPLPLMPAEPVTEEAVSAEEINAPQAGIFLFGQFQVIDKEGADITKLFTPLIKELFLLILISTYKTGRGITSDELNETLWNDRSVKDAKNNRSVNIVKLKNILQKLGNCVVAKQSGFWQFQTEGEPVYVDYEKYLAMLLQKTEPDKSFIRQLLKIAGKGSFLFQTEYNWLDDIKADISNAIIPTFLRYVNNQTESDPELVIEIANCIFHFDRLNEDALEYKCRNLLLLRRNALALKTYEKFIKDYHDMYGEEFSRPFSDIINHQGSTHGV